MCAIEFFFFSHSKINIRPVYKTPRVNSYRAWHAEEKKTPAPIARAFSYRDRIRAIIHAALAETEIFHRANRLARCRRLIAPEYGRIHTCTYVLYIHNTLRAYISIYICMYTHINTTTVIINPADVDRRFPYGRSRRAIISGRAYARRSA